MNFNWINLKEFGKYSGGDNIIKFGKGINIIYGPNEAGKTTMFNGFLSLLYGFKPADKEKNLFLNWENEKMEISGNITSLNKEYEVNRRMLSVPRGEINSENRTVSIGNNQLPLIRNISRNVFKSVYLLTSDDLIKMQDENWNEIEDRLIMNYGIDKLVSPRDVISNLNEEMRKIYKVRGNSQIKTVNKEVIELKKKRKEVFVMLENVETMKIKRNETEISLNKIKEKYIEIGNRIKICEKLKPIINIKKNLEILEEKIDTFENEFSKDIEVLKSQNSIEETISFLEENINTQMESINKLQLNIEKMEKIEEKKANNSEELLMKIAEYKNINEKINELSIRFSDTNKMVEEFLSKYLEIFSDDFSEDKLESTSRLNLTNLEIIIKKIVSLKDNISKYMEGLSANKISGTEKGGYFKSVFIIFIGVITILSGNLFFYKYFIYLGIFILSLGIILGVQHISYGGNSKILKSNKEKLNLEKDELNKYLNILRKELKLDIKNEEIMLSSPMNFLNLIQNLKKTGDTIIYERKKILEEKRICNNKIENIKIIFDKFDIEIKEKNFNQVKDNIELLKLKDINNKEILLRTEGIKETYRINLEKLNLNKAKKNEIISILESIGKGNYENGKRRFHEHLENIQKRFFIREEIEKIDPLFERRNELDTLSKFDIEYILNENLDNLKLEFDSYQMELDAYNIKYADIKKDIEFLMEKFTDFDLDELIENKELEMEELMEKYDELNFLKKIIEIFDQEYRDKNQPDIFKETSKFINLITNSKYSKIYSDDNNRNGIMIKDNDLVKYLDEGYSKGTKDQVYTAFRLSIAKKLDSKEDRLPIFLDEIFVNWDNERLNNFLDILEDLSTYRQVFIFTCHRWIAEKISDNLSSELIEIN